MDINGTMALTPSPALSLIFQDQIDVLLSGSITGQEVAAGVVSCLFAFFLLATLYNFFKDRVKLHFLLVIFTAIRVACFGIRAALPKHFSTGLLTAFEILYAIGFVPLVKVLINLWFEWKADAVARWDISDRVVGRGGLLYRVSRMDRSLFLALTIGAILAIVGAVNSYDASTLSGYDNGLKLRRAGYTIFLAIIVIVDILVLLGPLLSTASRSVSRDLFLLAVGLEAASVFLTVKQVFVVIAIFGSPNNLFKTDPFYSLEVLPELLALCILCFPGFIYKTLAYASETKDPNRQVQMQEPPGAQFQGSPADFRV